VPTYHISSQAFIVPPEIQAARIAALNLTFIKLVRTAWSSDSGEDVAQVGR
jgi:hypothetical protein